MEKYAIHIGLNKVNPRHYDGWDGKLNACLNDARFYKSLSEEVQFDSIIELHDENATSTNVLKNLQSFGEIMKAGDMLFITYSGHGSQVIDFNNDEIDDSYDETWCLYDRQLIDDELFRAFKEFPKGSKVIMFSDACHNGTMAREIKEINQIVFPNTNLNPSDKLLSRRAPANMIAKTFEKNSEVYLEILKEPAVALGEINTYVLLISACQDHETAKEFGEHGIFTNTVKQVLSKKIRMNYHTLFNNVSAEIPKIQTPNMSSYGNEEFDFRDEDAFFSLSQSVEIVDSQNVPSISNPKSQPGILIHSSTEINKLELQEQRSIQDEYSELWDRSYDEYLKRKSAGEDLNFIEPDARNVMEFKNEQYLVARGNDNKYLKNWPKPQVDENEFIWHLDQDHSQLRPALESVLKKYNNHPPKIRIGHLDTGYLEHISTPASLLREFGISFVKGENNNKGRDMLQTGTFAEQDGHGCATLAILAGNNIQKEDNYAHYEGYFGAIPFAEVIPIRICDTVYNLFNANDVARGIDYGVEKGCEAITMSMAGYPTRRVAKAINSAYEKGVVVVTAAGNNWFRGARKLVPKEVLFPAAFDRVVAAVGTCYNHVPYDYKAQLAGMTMKSEGGEYMQGNWGPSRMMKTAVAAYTPNLPWATQDNVKFFRSGGGTSSATPQVAAAFALYLSYYKEEFKKLGLDEKWKKIEASRKAIFNSARKIHKFKKYYGNGIIRADDALKQKPDLKSIKISNKAKVSFLGIIPFISQWLGQNRGYNNLQIERVDDNNLKEMISLEILQVLYSDPNLKGYIENSDYENLEDFDFLQDAIARTEFLNLLKQSPFASTFLKSIIQP